MTIEERLLAKTRKNLVNLDNEIRWWRTAMRRAASHDVAYACWGVTTGLMLAKDITRRAIERARP